AGGRNFVNANRVLREEPSPATVPSAMNSWFLGSGRAQSVPCSGAVSRPAGGCASDDRDTRNYWIMAPGAGHHPLRRNPDPNLGSPPKGRLRTTERAACWRQPRTRARPGRRDLVQSKTYEITFL